MSEESFQSTKITTYKVYQPIHVKTKQFAKGAKIEIAFDLAFEDIDKLEDENGPYVQAIRHVKNLCINELKTPILEGVEE